MNGDSATAEFFIGKVMAIAREVLWDVWRTELATPPNCTGSFFRWNPREYNKLVDSLATHGVFCNTGSIGRHTSGKQLSETPPTQFSVMSRHHLMGDVART